MNISDIQPRSDKSWEWADQMFDQSEFENTFEVDDCEYNEELDQFGYFDESGNVVIVDVQTREVFLLDTRVPSHELGAWSG